MSQWSGVLKNNGGEHPAIVPLEVRLSFTAPGAAFQESCHHHAFGTVTIASSVE